MIDDEIELPTSDQLEEITEQVWAAYIDDSEQAPIADPTAGIEMSASVAIVGAWQGHVVVSCSHSASREVTSVLLAMPLDEVSADDVGDALGELANVVGGNVKSLLPAPSKLALPTVGEHAHGRWPGTAEVCKTVLRWRGAGFTVTLLHGSRRPSLLEKVPA